MYVKQQPLKIPLPESLETCLYYSPDTVTAESGFSAGAVEVYHDDGTVMGVLAYFPSVSLKSLMGK